MVRSRLLWLSMRGPLFNSGGLSSDDDDEVQRPARWEQGEKVLAHAGITKFVFQLRHPVTLEQRL